MQPRLGLATVLCFTVPLLAGCAFGFLKPEHGGLGHQASDASAGALVAQATGRKAEKLGAQSEQGERIERAAAFHDYGRYYK